jgi:glycosyltransferase AglD
MQYSIVIPAHNEAENLREFVNEFMGTLQEFPKSVLTEVVIVENGSTDSTWAECQKLEADFPNLVRTFSLSRGSYGAAVKHGIEQCRGTHVSILECDFLDTEFIAESIRLFDESDSRFIVASKRHPNSSDRRPIKRRALTWAFNSILRLVVGYPGSDTHGLKSIDAPLARQLCELALTTDETFQTEIVILAWRLGHEIKELPINITERRLAPISVRQRLPKVVSMLSELRRSAARIPRSPGR